MVLAIFFQRIIGLPFWWYSSGLKAVIVRLTQTVISTIRGVALDVWIKNLFVPMYGDTSFAGRMISFGMRLVTILSKSLVVLLYVIVCFLIFILYLVFFPFVILGFLYSMGMYFV